MFYMKLLLTFIALTQTTARHLPFYRKDYTFVDEFDAFYKIHWDTSGLSWNSAFMTCDDEGAKLFYPKEEGEWSVVKRLADAHSIQPNVTDIFVGLHDEFGLGEYITLDGQSTSSPLSEDTVIADGQHCILMDIQTGAPKVDSCVASPDTIRPFVCKRVDDKPCPTVDLGYQYYKEAKKCYKINNRHKTWQDAMQTCFMEGGILTVIENKVEANVLRDQIERDILHFVGFRRIFSDSGFYTVKGKSFEESAYQNWYDRNNEQTQNCGAVRLNGNELLTKTQDCYIPSPFICEMKPKVQ